MDSLDEAVAGRHVNNLITKHLSRKLNAYPTITNHTKDIFNTILHTYEELENDTHLYHDTMAHW